MAQVKQLEDSVKEAANELQSFQNKRGVGSIDTDKAARKLSSASRDDMVKAAGQDRETVKARMEKEKAGKPKPKREAMQFKGRQPSAEERAEMEAERARVEQEREAAKRGRQPPPPEGIDERAALRARVDEELETEKMSAREAERARVEEAFGKSLHRPTRDVPSQEPQATKAINREGVGANLKKYAQPKAINREGVGANMKKHAEPKAINRKGVGANLKKKGHPAADEAYQETLDYYANRVGSPKDAYAKPLPYHGSKPSPHRPKKDHFNLDDFKVSANKPFQPL